MLNRVTHTFKPKRSNGMFLLGEYAEINDWKRGYHFSGGSGQELKRMCRETGFEFFDCYHDMVFSIPGHTYFPPSNYITDWVKKNPFVKPKYQPHVDHVRSAIHASGATLIIAFGDLALYALTGEKSVTKWRGSCLYTEIQGRQIKVIPTFAINRMLTVWSWRYIVMYDLERAFAESKTETYAVPRQDFLIAPDFPVVMEYLGILEDRLSRQPVWISHDLETIARNISCAGFATNATEALCIPFMTKEEGRGGNHNYWTVEEEVSILKLQKKVLTHPNARVIGQNYLYDMQHIAKSWGYQPNYYMDTMLAWHTLFPGEKKSLDFLASIFCDYYVFWKDELKDYNNYPADETVYWNYNCKDVVYTYEIATKVWALLEEAGQVPQYKFQMEMYEPVFHSMLRGVRIDTTLRQELNLELQDLSSTLEGRLLTMSGNFKPEKSQSKTHWFNSPQQCLAFFYDYLGLPKQFNRATHRPSTDDTALAKLAEKEPVVRPLIQRMQELRSANIFRKNFVEAPLGNDRRIRCSYNLAGTATFRLASSKDAFGQGANLQTIPSGTKK